MSEPRLHHILVFDYSTVEVERLIQLLKDSNYKTAHFQDMQQAYKFAISEHPDLIVFDIQASQNSGVHFFRQLKNHPATHKVPIILTTNESEMEKRIGYMEMGVDDFVNKPYYPEEIVARINMLLQDFPVPNPGTQAHDQGFRGSLKEMNLLDLIQTMELGEKSGIIYLNRGDKEGQIYINRGKIVDAVVEGYDTLDRAFLHMLTWIEGSFVLNFQPIDMENSLTENNQRLFDEGARIIDQWRKESGELPSLQTPLIAVKSDNLPHLSEAEQQMLTQFQETHTILQAIDKSNFDDFSGLKHIKSLLEKGVLVKTETPPQDVADTPTFRPYVKRGIRNAKNKYSHIFTLFSKKQKKDSVALSKEPLMPAEHLRLHKEKIANKIMLTKAELLLIKQKFSS